MGGAEEEKQRIADLEKEIAKRNRWIDQRNRRIDKLEEENERLRREIEKLQQAAKRQAAPFSRGEPKRHPKRRGRKPGKRYGRRAFRPVPRRIDRIVEVPAPLYCPDCQKQTKLDHLTNRIRKLDGDRPGRSMRHQCEPDGRGHPERSLHGVDELRTERQQGIPQGLLPI